MTSSTFRCRRCGHCCLFLRDAWNGEVSPADVARWQALGRDDLLGRIETIDLGHGNLLHLAWRDPCSGDDVERCPWLAETGEGWHCTIEAIKPDHCRAYPDDRRHAAMTGCPGFQSPRP